MTGRPGRSGRPPKPKAIHLLEGTYKPSRHDESHEWPRELPAAPSWLDEQGRRKYDELVMTLGNVQGLLAAVDGEMLSIYADTFSTFVTANKLLAVEGLTVTNPQSRLEKVHPAVAIKHQALTTMLGIARDFGMTPSSRGSLQLTTTTTESSDPFQEFLEMRCGG